MKKGSILQWIALALIAVLITFGGRVLLESVGVLTVPDSNTNYGLHKNERIYILLTTACFLIVRSIIWWSEDKKNGVRPVFLRHHLIWWIIVVLLLYYGEEPPIILVIVSILFTVEIGFIFFTSPLKEMKDRKIIYVFTRKRFFFISATILLVWINSIQLVRNAEKFIIQHSSDYVARNYLIQSYENPVKFEKSTKETALKYHSDTLLGVWYVLDTISCCSTDTIIFRRVPFKGFLYKERKIFARKDLDSSQVMKTIETTRVYFWEKIVYPIH